jgi:hypothetical protein
VFRNLLKSVDKTQVWLKLVKNMGTLHDDPRKVGNITSTLQKNMGTLHDDPRKVGNITSTLQKNSCVETRHGEPQTNTTQYDAKRRHLHAG